MLLLQTCGPMAVLADRDGQFRHGWLRYCQQHTANLCPMAVLMDSDGQSRHGWLRWVDELHVRVG